MAITSVRDIEPSNSAVENFNWFIVTDTAGAVSYEQQGGNIVALAAVPVGVWMPAGNGVRIRTASTAVGFMVA